MRIGLIGTGRMGKAVHEVIAGTSNQIVAEFDINKLMTKEAARDCDVLIDFSTAEALKANLDIALLTKIPMVSGTTGWYERTEEFKKLVINADGSFLYASNFSIGVLLFHKLLARAAELYGSFQQYDFALHEIHHYQKADSPSGTAITLAHEIMNKVPGKKSLQTGNSPAAIEPGKLHVSSSRVGSVPGTHTLYVESAEDSIEITHKARGRSAFAAGAVKAAEWLMGKKGFYSIDDMLKTLLDEK
jgi:4-hydroxy-tetrahydrodipicolinate reductase